MTRMLRAFTAALATVTVATALIAPPAQAGAPGHPSPATATASGATYTVRSGDYLIGIASKLKVRLADLLAVNKMTLSSLIYPGLVLAVPAGGVVPASSGSSASGSTLTYTVQKNDYLSGIAAKLGVTLSSLLAANHLTVKSTILPGSTLVVPAGGHLPAAAPAAVAAPAPAAAQYVVRAGDSLSGIATKMGVSLGALLTTNGLKVTSPIYPGSKLTVPPGGTLPATAPSGKGASATAAPGVATVLAFANAQLGEPYKFNAAGPGSWDCSGLTMMAYAQIGISLPHYSGAQVKYGSAVDWRTTAIRPGDLVFLESSAGSGVINHVGIAVSATQWIQAPRTGDVVRLGSIPSTRVVAVRRLVQGG